MLYGLESRRDSLDKHFADNLEHCGIQSELVSQFGGSKSATDVEHPLPPITEAVGFI